MSVVNGIKHAENLIKLVESKNGGSKFESVWKLLGDLTTFTRNVLTDVAFIKINNIDSMSSFISHHHHRHHHHHISGLGYGDKDLFIDNLDILLTVLKRGEAAYRKVIDIQQKSSSVCSESWYDLGMNIYEQANTMLTVKGQGSSLLYCDNIDCKIINSLIDEARGCFSKGINIYPFTYTNTNTNTISIGIRINPNCSNCYNGLGLTIVDDDDVVRQACFVKSINCDMNTSALTNLGLSLLLILILILILY